MPDEPTVLTANQLVGYNLKRVRLTLGLDQAQARARLKPYGLDLSKNVYSAAERSWDGKRVRQFTGDEILSMAMAFSVPVSYFFLPPRPEDRPGGVVLVSGTVDISWRRLVGALEDGEMRAAFEQRLMELPPGERPMRVYRESEIRQLQDQMDIADLARRHHDERKARETQPVVAAIVTSDLGVLIGHRNDRTPPWTFIAGEAEPGEQPAHTIIREVKEETGLEIEAGEVIGERDHPRTGRHMIYMTGRPVRETTIIIGDEAELDDVRWADLHEALEAMPDMFEPVHEYLARELGGEGES